MRFKGAGNCTLLIILEFIVLITSTYYPSNPLLLIQYTYIPLWHPQILPSKKAENSTFQHPFSALKPLHLVVNSPYLFPFPQFDIKTTLSTCTVPGNWSTAHAFTTLYPLFVITSKSLAREVGLQLI